MECPWSPRQLWFLPGREQGMTVIALSQESRSLLETSTNTSQAVLLRLRE